MFKNIQQHLLIKFPILWNIRLVPILLAVILSQVIFFLLGYILTDNTPQYNSFISGMYYLLYAASLLVGTLLLIFWLIRYNRNNGLRAFYPYTTLQLYLEWICIFLVCISIGFLPYALETGKKIKWQKVVSQTEQKKAMDILYKVNILIPTDEYKYELVGNQTPLLVGDAEVDRTIFDTKLYNYVEDAVTPDNPIEYVGPSFLYAKDNGRNSYWRYDRDATETVHRWLVNQNEDSIRSLMNSYLELQAKHKFKTNLDVDYWMSTVYNPPLYPVKELIEMNESTYRQHQYDKYTEYYDLFSYYEEIENSYGQSDHINWQIIVTLTIALGFSVLIFSSRVTSGRFWVYSLLTAGVLVFIYFILLGLCALLDSFGPTYLFVPTFWLALFIAIAIILGNKITSGSRKGRSNIHVNLGLWMIPTVIPLVYTLYRMITEKAPLDEDTIIFILLIINIIAVIIAMFPISMLIRKWKSLPED